MGSDKLDKTLEHKVLDLAGRNIPGILQTIVGVVAVLAVAGHLKVLDTERISKAATDRIVSALEDQNAKLIRVLDNRMNEHEHRLKTLEAHHPGAR